MDIAQVSSLVWMQTMPVVAIAGAVTGVLLGVSACIIRWRRVSPVVRRILNRDQYDYARVFRDYLKRFNDIHDRDDLYPAILSTTCRIIGASGASLLILDNKGNFQIRASFGLKPFAFKIEDAKPFLAWFEKHREIVTRTDLVQSKKFIRIKSDGLRYFVQFNSEATIPLYIDDKLCAIINLGSRDRGIYDHATRDLLKVMSVQFAMAIHNTNLYSALLLQNRKLEETSRFKTQLIANLSHELRTPLSTIIGLSELMAEGGDGEVTTEQMEHLSLIRRAGVRLHETLNSILDLSKLEGNRISLEVQKVNLGKLLAKVAQGVPVGNGTKLELKIGEETPGVYGDELRLHQILKHLLDNAAKFTKRGKISVGAERCGDMLKVCIADTGVGIDKEKQKEVFTEFTQGDGSATREFGGLGLGLAISKRLVELHGGRMWLKSEKGRGSTFNFTLPLKPIGIYDNDKQKHS